MQNESAFAPESMQDFADIIASERLLLNYYQHRLTAFPAFIIYMKSTPVSSVTIYF